MEAQKPNKFTSFVESNTKWLALILFAIVMLYFDSKYSSHDTVSEIRKQVTANTENIRNNTNEIKDVEDRQEKKVKIQKEIIKEVDKNENDIIEIKTIQKTKLWEK